MLEILIKKYLFKVEISFPLIVLFAEFSSTKQNKKYFYETELNKM